MKITRTNYESWFLDHLEGRLEEGMAGEFNEFLRQNPDLREELEEYREVNITAPELSYAGKEELFREGYDQPEVFEQAAVARLEGDLSPEEADAFEDYLLRHPGKKAEAELFGMTRLTPDPAVVFTDKSRLLRQPVLIRLRQWTLRAAAVLLVGLLVYTLADKPVRVPDNDGLAMEGTGNRTGQEEQGIASESLVPETSGTLAAEEVAVPANGGDTGRPEGHRKNVTATFITAVQTASHRISRTDPSSVPASGTGGKLLPVRIQAPPLLASLQTPLLATSSPEALKTLLPVALPATALKPEETAIAGFMEPMPLSEKFLHKTGLAKLSIPQIARRGLEFASVLSGEKITIDTNSAGEIIALGLETRLLGLSIPVRR